MGKTIWVIILIVVVVLLWFLFKGDSQAPADVEEETTEQTNENPAAAVEAGVSAEAGATTEVSN